MPIFRSWAILFSPSKLAISRKIHKIYILTLWVPTTYIYVFCVTPLGGQPRIYTWEARRAFFHLENARGRYGCMKHSLWPKKSSWKNNSNDTKNEMENRILPSVVLSAKFCKKHRCISGPLEHIIKKTPGTQRVNWLKDLYYSSK